MKNCPKCQCKDYSIFLSTVVQCSITLGDATYIGYSPAQYKPAQPVVPILPSISDTSVANDTQEGNQNITIRKKSIFVDAKDQNYNFFRGLLANGQKDIGNARRPLLMTGQQNPNQGFQNPNSNRPPPNIPYRPPPIRQQQQTTGQQRPQQFSNMGRGRYPPFFPQIPNRPLIPNYRLPPQGFMQPQGRYRRPPPYYGFSLRYRPPQSLYFQPVPQQNTTNVLAPQNRSISHPQQGQRNPYPQPLPIPRNPYPQSIPSPRNPYFPSPNQDVIPVARTNDAVSEFIFVFSKII